MRIRLLCTFLLAAATAVPASAQQAPAPVADLVRQIEIPWQSFTLPNGLRVIVHEDRKAPVVAVSVWYHVGSKDEPKGKTGFAHLFEHLMFNGSENAPGDFFEPLQQIGATDLNGTTWFDRTNYFETVPTPALERALFLESDRMGHMLGAVTQENLTNQIGVVQNEKREGDNQPYGLVEYAQLEALFPEGHPYRHSTIGSMADLTGASLEDVKNWFRAKYGPNNAVLVLAGDIDVPTAKRLVTKYFGDIPRGPEVTPAAAAVPTLAAPKTEVMNDRVATTRLYRIWAVPGLTDPAMVPLDVAAEVLGGLASSRLDNTLVRDDKIAVAVTANVQPFERVSLFEVTADVKPGVDAAKVAQRLDAVIADFIKNGPTADEVRRVATRQVASRLEGLESVGGFGGKAVALAEGALYAKDPDFYKKQLAAYASATPASVKAAAQKWLTRPVYALTVQPGERKAYEEAKSVTGTFAPSFYRRPAAGDKPLAPMPKGYAQGAASAGVDRSKLPDVAEVQKLDFPDIQRARLSNGIPIIYAQRDAVPVTRVSLSFDAGHAADPKNRLGTQSLMLALMDEGTATRSSVQIAEEQERLGARIGFSATVDRTGATLSVPTPNLTPALTLLSDIVRNPAFAPAEVERLRGEQLARIASELTQPQAIAARALGPILYGPQHPYGIPATGTGDPEAVKQVTRAELASFHQMWLRPDTAKIFVVSDRPLAEVQPLLEQAFGDWAATGAKGVKRLDGPVPPARERIVLIDRPQSPQSVIYGGYITPFTGKDDIDAVALSNDALGGTFLGRLNMDLREKKGWSYGVFGGASRRVGPIQYVVQAPVQANQTGPSLAALRTLMTDYLSKTGITEAERTRSINGRARGMAGNFETSEDVLGGLQNIELYGFRDDYYETLADKYRGMSAAELDAAIRRGVDPSKFVWVVVGDAAQVRPQLEATGLPIEVRPAA